MLKKLVLSTIVTVLSLLLLNVLAAFGERIAYGSFWVDGRPDGLYAHHSGERPRLLPGANLNGWLYKISVNHLGFRGKAPDPVKSDKHVRIWCIGGSTTFDIYAPSDAHTWPAQMQAWLQNEHPDKIIEVINAGIPGEIYSGSLADVNKHAQSVKPDFIVLYHGPNDLKEVLSLKRSKSAQGPEPTMLDSGDYALFRVLTRNFQKNRLIPESWQAHRFEQYHYDELERRVTSFIRNSRRLNIKPILATHAFRAGKSDTGKLAKQNVGDATLLFQQTPEETIKSMDRYNDLMVNLAERYRYPLADVRSAISSEPKNWGDATHFLAPGSKLAGKTVGQVIDKQIK
jgi:lysophospholipase L1-like esterase